MPKHQFAMLLVTAAGICACASGPRPTAELARAHALLDQAEQSGAQQFAGADLDAARSKLQLADRQDSKPEMARRLAEEAAVDAEVAAARTRQGKAEQAAKDSLASVESLRNESNRAQ